MGVIPARGGSRRVSRKNLQELGGKPLICWTIEAALASRLSRVVVSTEDPEIAAVAIRAGAEVVPQPIESALSGDMSAPVVLSALDFMRDAHGYEPHLVCLLHPTSPFRGAGHINHALNIYGQSPGASVISFSRDDLNGALYLTEASRLRDYGTYFVAPIVPLTMSEADGLDIDTWDDLERARRQVA